MAIRYKMGSKFLFYCHLPIKVFLSIIFPMERWNGKFNFSIRIIVTLIVLVLITSHTYFILEVSSSTQAVRVGLNVVRQTIETLNNILLQFLKTIIVILLVFIIIGLGRISPELLNPPS